MPGSKQGVVFNSVPQPLIKNCSGSTALEPGELPGAPERLSRVCSQPAQLNTASRAAQGPGFTHKCPSSATPGPAPSCSRGKLLARHIWLGRRCFYKPLPGAAPRASVPSLSQPLKPLAELFPLQDTGIGALVPGCTSGCP